MFTELPSDVPFSLEALDMFGDDDETNRSDMRSEAGESVASIDDVENISTELDQIARARRTLADRLHGKGSKKLTKATDEYYAACLTLRAEPVPTFLKDGQSKWALPITSMNEERLLKVLGLAKADRNQIEGLRTGRVVVSGEQSAIEILTEAQLAARAINRLAGDPLPEVGTMQRRTAHKLLRPYPHGLRFSGKNMSPLPAWLAGAQNVALNMSNNDVPVQLHFALFKHSAGFVLKPREMCVRTAGDKEEMSARGSQSTLLRAASDQGLLLVDQRGTDAGQGLGARDAAASRDQMGHRGSSGSLQGVSSGTGSSHDSVDDFWPPPRQRLERVTLEIVSLHNCPKRGEQRPRWSGSRSACHAWARHRSG